VHFNSLRIKRRWEISKFLLTLLKGGNRLIGGQNRSPKSEKQNRHVHSHAQINLSSTQQKTQNVPEDGKRDRDKAVDSIS
jgi:hypothetical protein